MGCYISLNTDNHQEHCLLKCVANELAIIVAGVEPKQEGSIDAHDEVSSQLF